MSRQDRDGRSREVDRYRKAASDALALLDWCIEYFADNGQRGIAGRLARNRNHIRQRLKG